MHELVRVSISSIRYTFNEHDLKKLLNIHYCILLITK